MKYFYTAGIFPFNCSADVFAKGVEMGCMGYAFDSMQEILSFCKEKFNELFFRIFAVDDDGEWFPVVGFSHVGCEIDNSEWEIFSTGSLDMFLRLPENTRLKLVNDIFLNKESSNCTVIDENILLLGMVNITWDDD